MLEETIQTHTMGTTLTKYGLGHRVTFIGYGPATVVYSKRKHSVSGYQGYALIRIEHEHPTEADNEEDHYGWSGKDGRLVPDDAQHLRSEHNLLWVKWNRLVEEEPYDGFEVDQ